MKTAKELVQSANVRARAAFKAAVASKRLRHSKSRKERFVETRQGICDFIKRSGAYEW